MPPSIDKADALRRINDVAEHVITTIEQMEKHVQKNPEATDAIITQMGYELSLRLKQTIIDLTPRGNHYRTFAESLVPPYSVVSVNQLIGALKALRKDYENNYLQSFNEMIDAELFTDILEQAEYLLSKGFVGASAVVAGVALESHLRKLSEKNSIKITKDDGSYMNADTLNGELRKKEVIDKTTNKSITGWLGLRNDAAHPDTKEINEGLIEPMIAGIRVFIQQYPA